MQPKGSGGARSGRTEARWYHHRDVPRAAPVCHASAETRRSPTLEEPLDSPDPSRRGTPFIRPIFPRKDEVPHEDAPGLKDQFRATKDAAQGLLTAHIDLAKTELSAIAGSIAKTAGLVALAFAVLALAGMLLFIGSALFFAEWLLGSMGWGVLHGVLFLAGVAVAAVLGALGYGAGTIVRSFIIALIVGILVAVVLGLHLPNQAYTAVGDAVVPGVDPAWRTILVGAVLGAIVLGVILLIVGLQMGGGAAVGLAVLGIVLGALLGAFTAITFDWGPAVGTGLAVAYLLWIGLMIGQLARGGVDVDALKARFMPTQTIDTTKETVEWLKRRMPRGNES
jgi:hypothetical protein